jgi:hypothetical protein
LARDAEQADLGADRREHRGGSGRNGRRIWCCANKPQTRPQIFISARVCVYRRNIPLSRPEGLFVSIYLDNNVVSAIATNDTPPESAALIKLIKAYGEGRIGLVTSELTLGEINAFQGSMRPQIKQTFESLKLVPTVRWDELMGINSQIDPHTMINTPMIQNDPLYQQLLELGVQTVDAQHVFVAAKNACPAFLTCDKGILRHSSAIGKLCPVTVQKPSVFVTSQGL